MNRTALVFVLAASTAFGAVFAFYPQLDLAIAGFFVKSGFRSDLTFGLRASPLLWLFRDSSIWVSALLVAPAAAALAWKTVRPHARMLIPARAALFLIATLALGPGLLTNVILKSHWGRPRPIDVTEFGGIEHFVAWWDPRGDCPSNCSFVSGDVSGAFWTLAVAAVAPPAWRLPAYTAALAFGGIMALMRMAAGAHFPSDIFFAGSFTFIVIWLVHALLYRWPSTRTTDRAIEQAIERLSWRGPAKAPRDGPPSRLISRAKALVRYLWSEADLAAPVVFAITGLLGLATIATHCNLLSLARTIVHATLALALIVASICAFYMIALLRSAGRTGR
ncbi:MAG TPA: phosphatase PAP2 family protein [Pseudorhodoplanes sp.]|nr:phosphatase PAP2 family protein [Pseudorhodoplanes sp.]